MHNIMIKEINNLFSFLSFYNLKNTDIQIVISRFNENFNHWLILKDFIIIYNKGEPILNNLDFNIINIQNIGRESHTYLYHIINNFNNLKTITLFIQCDFSDHIHEIFNLYKYFIFKNTNMIINLKNKNTCCINGWGRLLKFTDYKTKNLILSKYTFGEWWINNISHCLPNLNSFKWGPCGVFSISKNNIIKKDIEYYKKILNTLSYCINPEEGHYCERAWFYIFN